jgi:hypothetical protein
MCSHADSH